MKRILVLAAAVGMAASLFADRSFLSGSGFEKLDVGDINLTNAENEQGLTSWWLEFTGKDVDTSDMAKIAAYANGEAKPDSREGDDYFPADTPADGRYRTNGENTKYLALDTGSTVVARNVTADQGGKDVPDAGMYVDTMVQFTASDTQPSVDSNLDRILVWLYANPDTPSVTNIVITAGTHVLGDGGTIQHNPKNYQTNVRITENTWCRLTIVANKDPVWGIPSFTVYINGEKVEGTDSNGEKLSSFLSIRYDSDTYKFRLNAICFQGQGAVDDIVVGTETPFPLTEIAYTITPGEGVASFKYQVGESEEVTVNPARKVVLSDVTLLDKPIVVKPAYEDGYVGKLSYEATITAEGSLNLSASTSFFTVTIDGEDTGYTTMGDVWTAIESVDSATITLNTDYTLGEEEWLEIYNDVTFDLNGNTIEASSVNNDILYVGEGASLTLIDSVGNGNGKLKFASYQEEVYLIRNQGSLTIGVQDGSNDFTLDNGAVINETDDFTIYGGKFKSRPLDETQTEITDFSAICPTGYTLALNNGYYVLTRSGETGGDITIDSFECDFTVDANTATAITKATGVGTTEDNFAKAAIAYVVGGTLEEGEVVIPTPTITVDGTTVTVTYDSENAQATGYTVTCTLYSYDLATGTKIPVDEGTIGSGLTDNTGSAASKFYVVGVKIQDAQ